MNDELDGLPEWVRGLVEKLWFKARLTRAARDGDNVTENLHWNWTTEANTYDACARELIAAARGGGEGE
jgi:hypothetical protein